MAVPGKAELRKAIQATGGVVSDLAKHYSASRQTIYNWLDAKDLRDELNAARQNLIDVAQDNIYGALMDGDLDISKFVLERKGRQFGWTRQIDVGQAVPLSNELKSLLDEMGITPEQIGTELLPVLRELKALQEAEAHGGSA
ncbi:hypothetical protein G4Y79_15190 [Phototrophicus methaneseepsis]|uniref:Uncharacterized protein n=1 Tax=Phototrophicus methaneseepsis TaxID=2710758 RepID=A0A7S8E620_9CHLR|nr:hypothetical protein [Phototrophicus methaneseepsis]QPC81047.1 hypothetical protein G4Y79_15190 [Phototrophicus methaneseepsis]